MLEFALLSLPSLLCSDVLNTFIACKAYIRCLSRETEFSLQVYEIWEFLRMWNRAGARTVIMLGRKRSKVSNLVGIKYSSFRSSLWIKIPMNTLIIRPRSYINHRLSLIPIELLPIDSRRKLSQKSLLLVGILTDGWSFVDIKFHMNPTWLNSIKNSYKKTSFIHILWLD